MTLTGDWRPVASRGRFGAAVAAPLGGHPDRGQVPAEQSANGHPSAATCIFCARPSGDVTYAWPDWLCRAIAQHQDHARTDSPEADIDLVSLEQAEVEADKITARVCETCRQGWIQRLEDNVSPFLTSMIEGVATPLPPARRKLLARWAAKTAIVLEFAGETSRPTPRFAREHLRVTGVHPGTQVLVGRYEGRRIFHTERDLSVRVASGEPRHLSQTSLVMGHVLIQVFADPWRDAPPELSEDALQPFIALIGGRGSAIAWPPAVSIDDDGYDLLRLGPALARRTTHAPSNVAMGPESIMATNGGRDQPRVAMGDRDADGWTTSMVHSPDVLPDAPDDRTPFQQTPPATIGGFALEDAGRAAEPAAVEYGANVAYEAIGRTPRRPRPRRRVAVAALALVAAGALVGFGVHERSNAQRSHARSVTLQRRTQALVAQLRLNAQQLSANEATITQLNNRVAALATHKTRTPNQSAELRQILAAVPAATDGVRQCANAAFDAASSAVQFAAAYPQSATQVDTAATNAAAVCARAGQAANALDQLADRAGG